MSYRTPQNTKPNTRTLVNEAIGHKIGLAFTVLKSVHIWADRQTS